MAEIYSLYLMEILIQANGTLPLEDVWQYFLMQFPHTWDNFPDFEAFVHSQSMLFGVQNNYIFLKDTQAIDSIAYYRNDFNPVFPLTQVHVGPLPPPPRILHAQDFTSEAEAVKYFQRQISRRNEPWVPIKSLAGHLSQASTNIRAVVGPQSDFLYFLLRHPRIFEVQGDLVSLRDEVRLNYLSRQSTQIRQNNSSRRNRPLSMYVSSGICSLPQSKNETSEYSNVSVCSSQSVQNLPQQTPMSEQLNSSQTILISLVDYAAAMWLRQAIEKLGATKDCGVLLDDLMQEFVSAPVNIRNSVGLTRIEVTEFLEKFNQLFEIDQIMCKNKVLDKASTTFIISDSASANSRSISLINKKGIAYCISRSWGIIDLGQHEHVFFDRSLFKHVENLTKHFAVGETLCFNAVLAPKESRAKWRATRVWKETDILAAQLTELGLASSLTSQVCDYSSSIASSTPSEGNSDSGVQDATVQKPPSSSISTGLESLLNNSEFNIVRLDVGSSDKLLVLQEPEGLDDSEDEVNNISNGGKVACGGTKDLKSSPTGGDIVEGDQSDDNTSSDLNTMSDIPSISSCLPASVAMGNFVSLGTQTYFTGDILAKKVYHEIVNSEQQQDE
ncbi:conserved hypothetical protein [Echinococcus multilocularis]|uniref:Egal-1 winged helix domain-containing protein n=1 Tax=Echinococcus multilocularis TaxID=6211 RepID=A0A068YFX7_ECHMU|nr:conserved hypothetical protein [Echinococcus multilocularis]